ncbi:MAG TPA: YraN family protein [Campylobacterales bacterium]|nr:YraN family protein [Campylobacterales bacterium]
MSRAKGNIAEDKAVSFLQDGGFKIIDRNYYSRFGEIDIIASKEDVLHFIEVKSGDYDPIYQITPQKISKIIKTANIYMQKKKIDCDYCFDAVIVTEEIEFIENITL